MLLLSLLIGCGDEGDSSPLGLTISSVVVDPPTARIAGRLARYDDVEFSPGQRDRHFSITAENRENNWSGASNFTLHVSCVLVFLLPVCTGDPPTWSIGVSVVPGVNRIKLTATAQEGATETKTIRVSAGGSPNPALILFPQRDPTPGERGTEATGIAEAPDSQAYFLLTVPEAGDYSIVSDRMATDAASGIRVVDAFLTTVGDSREGMAAAERVDFFADGNDGYYLVIAPQGTTAQELTVIPWLISGGLPSLEGPLPVQIVRSD